MFRRLWGHHQAYLKQFFKILPTLLGSHQCLLLIAVGYMFRRSQDHHQAYLKQVFKILPTLLESH